MTAVPPGRELPEFVRLQETYRLPHLLRKLYDQQDEKKTECHAHKSSINLARERASEEPALSPH